MTEPAVVDGSSPANLRFQLALKEVLSGGSRTWLQHLESVELSITQTFHALPKDANGRLDVRSARYLLHKHLAKDCGWLLQGLEFHGYKDEVSKEIHRLRIFESKVPELAQALSEARPADHGFSLGDMVAIFAAIEQLVLDDTLQLLQIAYKQNNRSTKAVISEKALEDILLSYLLNIIGGTSKLTKDVKAHRKYKQHKLKQNASSPTSWKEMVIFQRDAVHNYLYAYRRSINPFAPRRFTLKAVVQIAEDIAMQFGRWQDVECRQMKEDLMEMDPDGSGRVPLSTFYKHRETADYQFSESTDYLRTIGALDESVPSAPRVRIANYVMGPSNCIAHSDYYCVCCLSECEKIIDELHEEIQAPTVEPQRRRRPKRRTLSRVKDGARKRWREPREQVADE